MKSSSPLNWKVNAYPLGSLQWGHFLLRPWTPSYQIFTHSSHPKRLLQHLVAIIAGFMGVSWQIVHWNASFTSFVIPSGKGNDLLTSSISVTMHFTSFISRFIWWKSWSFSVDLNFLLDFFETKSSSLPSEISEAAWLRYVAFDFAGLFGGTLTFSSLMRAKIFLLPHFQKDNPL